MKIDGNLIASEIKEDLKKKIAELFSQNIIPHLAVVLIGNDPASLTYVRRKQKIAHEIRAKVTLFKYDSFARKTLIKLVNKLNNDLKVHGIIIQRPVPIDIDKEELDNAVLPAKDIDGFHPKSKFNSPIAKAVIKILNYTFLTVKAQSDVIAYDCDYIDKSGNFPFLNWMKKKRILIIGRGETAGKPIAKYFTKLGIPYQVVHSKTLNLKSACLKSDVIVSCVGKPNVVRHDMVTKTAVVIGVGLHTENGKLATDYIQDEIGLKAAYYTPVPGGVGPVNVACLFDNLIKAAIITD